MTSRGVPLCGGASGAGKPCCPLVAAACRSSGGLCIPARGERPSPRVRECLPLGTQVTRTVSGPQAPWRRQTDTQMGRMVSSSLGRPGGGLQSPRDRAGPAPWVGVVRDPQFHPSSLAWTHGCREVLRTLQVSHPRCSLFPQAPPEGVREACWIPETPPLALQSCRSGRFGMVGIVGVWARSLVGALAEGVLQPLTVSAAPSWVEDVRVQAGYGRGLEFQGL